MPPGHKRLQILEVQSALHEMPESTIRHIYSGMDLSSFDIQDSVPTCHIFCKSYVQTPENIKLYKVVAMLTHEGRCGSKRPLSAVCKERSFQISPTICFEWKR